MKYTDNVTPVNTTCTIIFTYRYMNMHFLHVVVWHPVSAVKQKPNLIEKIVIAKYH